MDSSASAISAQLRLPADLRGPELRDRLRGFLEAAPGGECLLPWTHRLDPEQRVQLQSDLALILSEPDLTGEPLDWHEVEDILTEWAEAMGHAGPLVELPPVEAGPAVYQVDIRSAELRALERASPAVQRIAHALLSDFLPIDPANAELLGSRRLKKMSNRGIWQVDLPDGYRLRYLLEEDKRVVYVVYLGRHLDGQLTGREQAVQESIHRRRFGG